MIHLPKVRAVYFKEMRDSLRDRRTIFATIVVPVLLYPIFMVLVSEAARIGQAKIEKEQFVVAIHPEEELPRFAEIILKYHKINEDAAARRAGTGKVGPGKDGAKGPDKEDETQSAGGENPPEVSGPKLRFMASTNPRADLHEGTIHAVVLIPPHFDAAVHGPSSHHLNLNEVPQIEILYDRAERRSQGAANILIDALQTYNGSLIKDRLASQDLGDGFIQPFKIKQPVNVASAQKVGGSALGSFLPLLFILMIITGALTPAIDLTAGEKERSTLETLISAPVRPLEVIMGKFSCVASLALMNALLNVLSFGLTVTAVGIDKIEGFQFPWPALPATLLLLLPLALFFSALLLAVTSFASSYKEAQVYVLPVYLIPMLGLMVVMLPGIELEGPLLIAPVVNTALLIKELFLGRKDLAQSYLFVLLSTCFYAGAAVGLAARIFAREEVLFSAQGSLRLFLRRRFIRPQLGPGAGDGLLLVALTFPIWFYFSSALQKALLDPSAIGTADPNLWSLGALIFLPQVVAFLGVPLLVAWYLKFNLSNTFQWRKPTARALLAAAMLGGSSWILIIQFFEFVKLVFPSPNSEEMAFLEPLLKGLGPLGTVLLLAVTPAFCEEMLFRGFLFSGMRTTRQKWLTIVLTGVFFGAFHLPLIRQPAVALMGITLGYLAWESRSIWPCMIFHVLHNGLSVTVGGHIDPTQGGQIKGGPLLVNLEYLLPALVVFALGLVLARGCGGADPDEASAGTISDGPAMEDPRPTAAAQEKSAAGEGAAGSAE